MNIEEWKQAQRELDKEREARDNKAREGEAGGILLLFVIVVFFLTLPYSLCIIPFVFLYLLFSKESVVNTVIGIGLLSFIAYIFYVGMK